LSIPDSKPFSSPWQSALFTRSVAGVRLLLGKWPHLERRLVQTLVRNQNRRVARHLSRNPVTSMLLIMPRCVKKVGCGAPVQTSLEQCATCFDCPLGDVTRLCRQYGVKALVAFRSHIAFEMARTHQPDVIVATACEDRLVKALRSLPEIPALLTPLKSLDKMCINAQVDLVWLEEQLALITGLKESRGVTAASDPADPTVTMAPSASVKQGPSLEANSP